jgi:hypothetical protein
MPPSCFSQEGQGGWKLGVGEWRGGIAERAEESEDAEGGPLSTDWGGNGDRGKTEGAEGAEWQGGESPLMGQGLGGWRWKATVGTIAPLLHHCCGVTVQAPQVSAWWERVPGARAANRPLKPKASLSRITSGPYEEYGAFLNELRMFTDRQDGRKSVI